MMDGQAQQQISSEAQALNAFSIGVSSSSTDANAQGKTPRQVEEKRKNELFQVDTNGEKSKRQREEFAEKLRKNKR